MFSLQSKLDSAMGVFNKAKKKLDAVIESCDKDDKRANEVEESATEVFDQVMSIIKDKRSQISTVRKNAQAYLENINKIIGE